MAWIATVLLLVMVTTSSASVIGIPPGTSTSLRDGGVSVSFEDYRDGLHTGSGSPDGASAAAGLMEDAATDGLGYMSGVRLYTGAAESDSGFGAAARRAGEEAAGGGRRVVRQKPPGTVYDHIFNIPKTVLRSVNQGLNNRQDEEEKFPTSDEEVQDYGDDEYSEYEEYHDDGEYSDYEDYDAHKEDNVDSRLWHLCNLQWVCRCQDAAMRWMDVDGSHSHPTATAESEEKTWTVKEK
ncbi:uncharacterized protein LOC126176246 [Schistocerca cancellata]|uniref:uncharacterized protein LOC126176246 n=1 Tax=Schistocerca cancellata TaxID=274614 RepID=UPI002117C538|nr:uncharacterized protein LOC126176246 [Schistocerca cancellata]